MELRRANGRKLHTTAKHSSSQQNQLRGMASTCDTIAGRCEEPSMRLIAIRLAASSVLPCLALAENYKTKVTTTSTVMGKTKTSTRMLQGKWIGADCGDVKPLTPPGVRK